MSAHPEIRRSEAYENVEDQVYVVLVGANGQDLSVSETFTRKEAAYENIEAQKRALEGEVRDLT